VTKKEIYILLRHELDQRLDAQDERLAKLESDVRAALDTIPKQQEQAQDAPHESESENATLAGIFRQSPDLKRLLLSSGIDSFPRLMTFLSDFTPERIEAIKAVAKQEGY